jgi:hypothetical protein
LALLLLLLVLLLALLLLLVLLLLLLLVLVLVLVLLLVLVLVVLLLLLVVLVLVLLLCWVFLHCVRSRSLPGGCPLLPRAPDLVCTARLRKRVFLAGWLLAAGRWALWGQGSSAWIAAPLSSTCCRRRNRPLVSRDPRLDALNLQHVTTLEMLAHGAMHCSRRQLTWLVVLPHQKRELSCAAVH